MKTGSNSFSQLTLFIFMTFICVNATFAQKNFKWNKKISPAPPIPERFQDADAVIIYSTEIRQTKFEDYKFFSRNIFKQRIKIQTQQGLEEHARIILAPKDGMEIYTLDARTIKQDGSFVDLDTKTEIKEIEIADDDDLIDSKKYKVFSIPGVEVGDEIEFVCIQEGFALERGGTHVLHKTIPSLKTKFILELFDKRIAPLATNRNRMPLPIITDNLNSKGIKWQLANVPGLGDQRGNVSAKTLPCFIYELNLDAFYRNSYAAAPNIKSWSDLLHFNNDNYYEVNIRSDKKMAEMYDLIVAGTKSEDKFEQLNAIQNYMNEVQYATIPDKEASEGIEFFLENKKGDFNTIVRMYKAVLEKFGLPYYFAAARSKYWGPIDLDFPTSAQISDYLFLVEVDGKTHALPIQSRTRYGSNCYSINEIPMEYFDTDIYMIDVSDKEVFKSIKLPENKKNGHGRKAKAMVNLKEGTIDYEMKETLNGAKSTVYRNDHYKLQEKEKLAKELLENLEGLKIDEVTDVELSDYPTTFPYEYNINYKYQTENQITEMDDKIYKISLENLFDHHIQKANKDRLLDFYPPYRYSDTYTFMMVFDSEVKLSNQENLNFSEMNPAASYKITVDQINPTSIIVKSTYSIRKSQIKIEDIQQLIDVNDNVALGDNEGIIIEVL